MIRRIALVTSLVLTPPSLYATTYMLEPDYTQGVFRWNGVCAIPEGQGSGGRRVCRGRGEERLIGGQNL
jgi:hypothetical protein